MRAWALLAIGLGACGPVKLTVPVEPEARAVVLVADTVESIEVFSFDLDRGEISSVELDAERASIWALIYRESLINIGLDPGPQMLGASGVELSQPGAIYMSTAPHTEATWTRIDTLPERIIGLRLAVPNQARQCLERGGCFGEGDRCERPCAEPPVPSPPMPPSVVDTPPSPPEPIDLGSCPPFATRTWEDVSYCAPYDSPSCVPPELQLPGSDHCERLGRCIPGRFPALPSSREPWYVDVAAIAPGDGTMSAPFQAVDQAIIAATGPAAIAIARGTYAPAYVGVDDDVELFGACDSEVVIDGGAMFSGLGAAGRVIVHDLVLAGVYGVYANLGAQVTLDGVELRGSDTALLLDNGAQLVADRVSVRASPDGISVRRGSRMRLSRAVITDSNRPLAVLDASTATVSELAVRGSRALPGAVSGYGMRLLNGAQLRASYVGVTDVDNSGIIVSGAGSVAVVDHLHVERVGLEPDQQVNGHAVVADTGGHIELTQSALLSVRFTGLFTADPGSKVIARDLFVADIPSSSLPPGQGYAAFVQLESELEIHRARFDGVNIGASVTSSGALVAEDVHLTRGRRNAIGFAVEGPGDATITRVRIEDGGAALRTLVAQSRLTASDLWASGRAPVPDLPAIDVDRGTMQVDRVVLEQLSGHGFALEGGELRGADWWVRDTGRLDLRSTAGIVVDGSVTLDAERVLLEHTGIDGVRIDGTSNVTLRDLRIEGTNVANDDHPEGVSALSGADITLERVAIGPRFGTGLFARGTESAIHASDVRIDGIHRDCPVPQCSEDPMGSITAERTGQIFVDRFVISDGLVPALFALSAGRIEVTKGIVERNTIGFKTDDPGYDLLRVIRGVSYRGNDLLLELE